MGDLIPAFICLAIALILWVLTTMLIAWVEADHEFRLLRMRVRLRGLAGIAMALVLSGCLVRNLRTPAEDHAVQASAVAQSCEADGYGEGKCTQADLDAMAQQARCIHAALRGKRCTEAE